MPGRWARPCRARTPGRRRSHRRRPAIIMALAAKAINDCWSASVEMNPFDPSKSVPQITAEALMAPMAANTTRKVSGMRVVVSLRSSARRRCSQVICSWPPMLQRLRCGPVGSWSSRGRAPPASRHGVTARAGRRPGRSPPDRRRPGWRPRTTSALGAMVLDGDGSRRPERGLQVSGGRGPHERLPLLEVGDRAPGDQSALVDHDDVVGQVLDLGQQVARHQHGAPPGGPGPEQLAQRPDALGIEAVPRLVEHQCRRVAQ